MKAIPLKISLHFDESIRLSMFQIAVTSLHWWCTSMMVPQGKTFFSVKNWKNNHQSKRYVQFLKGVFEKYDLDIQRSGSVLLG